MVQDGGFCKQQKTAMDDESSSSSYELALAAATAAAAEHSRRMASEHKILEDRRRAEKDEADTVERMRRQTLEAYSEPMNAIDLAVKQVDGIEGELGGTTKTDADVVLGEAVDEEQMRREWQLCDTEYANAQQHRLVSNPAQPSLPTDSVPCMTYNDLALGHTVIFSAAIDEPAPCALTLLGHNIGCVRQPGSDVSNPRRHNSGSGVSGVIGRVIAFENQHPVFRVPLVINQLLPDEHGNIGTAVVGSVWKVTSHVPSPSGTLHDSRFAFKVQMDGGAEVNVPEIITSISSAEATSGRSAIAELKNTVKTSIRNLYDMAEALREGFENVDGWTHMSLTEQIQHRQREYLATLRRLQTMSADQYVRASRQTPHQFRTGRPPAAKSSKSKLKSAPQAVGPAHQRTDAQQLQYIQSLWIHAVFYKWFVDWQHTPTASTLNIDIGSGRCVALSQLRDRSWNVKGQADTTRPIYRNANTEGSAAPRMTNQRMISCLLMGTIVRQHKEAVSATVAGADFVCDVDLLDKHASSTNRGWTDAKIHFAVMKQFIKSTKIAAFTLEHKVVLINT